MVDHYLDPSHHRFYRRPSIWKERHHSAPQAAQTLFVIYIRDSIALRFEPFKRMYDLMESSNRQNGFRTTLERLSCHKDFKITQAQTKVSFFYLTPLLQVEFRAIFEPFSYILLNGSKRNAILSRM